MTTLIDPQDGAQIEFVLKQLRENEAVALPTETVYGLAARALSPLALARVFELKARPTFDPLIVHVLDWSQLHSLELVETSTLLHKKLASRFWPGPLTLLFQKSPKVPDLCTASTPHVAVRAPEHPIFRRILRDLGEALAAPSANRFQSISPTRPQDVLDELGPYGLVAVVDGGICQRGIESTVVKIHSEDRLEIVRPGAISQEEIRVCVGPDVKFMIRESGSGSVVPQAHESPGQSEIHYAPQKPLYLLPISEAQEFLDASVSSRVALLEVFPSNLRHSKVIRRECLSSTGSWPEAASRLFSSLRLLDRDPMVDTLVVISCASENLGVAIMDRLQRASQKR